MKKISTITTLACLIFTGCQTRYLRTAKDMTPGNPVETQLDWTYGVNDIRIQTSKLTKKLMDRWFIKTAHSIALSGKPSIIITEIDNRTDQYISTDMIRDILEGVAINDGRFTVVVGDSRDERELDKLLQKQQLAPKYNNPTMCCPFNATAPHFLGKVRLTKAMTRTPCYDIEDYRMTMTLYNIETEECIDQAFDLLRKHVRP